LATQSNHHHKLQILLILALALVFSACTRTTPAAQNETQAVTSVPANATPTNLTGISPTSTPSTSGESTGEVQASSTEAAPQAAQSTPTQQELTPTSPAATGGSAGNGTVAVTATPAATQGGSENQTENAASQETSPTASATQSPQAASSEAQSGGTCNEKAAFYGDVTIPDKTPFQQGESFVKIWKVRNEGTCNWGPGYTLVFAGGDIMNGPASQPLPPAAIGETVEISVDLNAPMSGGVFTGNWEFEDPNGQRFGVGAGGHGYIWAQISVNWIGNQAASASTGTTASEGGSASTASSCTVQTDPAYESQVLALINQARADQGVAPLAAQNQLAAAALVHSTDMACQDYVDHIGSDGSRYYDRILAQGYSYAAASENIYVGDPAFGGTPEGAFEWWMNSDIHRRTILNPKYTQAGVAYVYLPGSTYGGYYTVEFAQPK
jgi:uncharacterized protein YkwD